MIRMLIIEDDPQLAGLIYRFLSPLTTRSPVIAYNMDDAMNIIGDANPVDLVTLDLGMPDSTSEETIERRIKEIKEKQPNCLLVVVTGARREAFEKEALANGADGFMNKLESCRNPKTFWETLGDIVKSIRKQPERYKKNLPLLEKLTERICDASKTQPLA